MDKDNKFESEWDDVIGLALVACIFSENGFDEINQIIEESKAPTTIKSLEKRVRITNDAIVETLKYQQDQIKKLETKIETIKKSLKR